ncbi:hypothetical protein PspLS_07681 [Pyricularia sp. CBS 133598]|nr:hypothetical protein PspLS_07681 [Pyricularia sp. CBS 133598]
MQRSLTYRLPTRTVTRSILAQKHTTLLSQWRRGFASENGQEPTSESATPEGQATSDAKRTIGSGASIFTKMAESLSKVPAESTPKIGAQALNAHRQAVSAEAEKSNEKMVDSDEPYHFHIYSHKHNTHVTVTDPNRDAIVSLSTGNLGFKKSGRKHYDSAYQLGALVIDKLQEKGLHNKINKLEVVLRGFGAGREAVTKVLMGNEGRLFRPKIVSVADSTRLKFGGTRRAVRIGGGSGGGLTSPGSTRTSPSTSSAANPLYRSPSALILSQTTPPANKILELRLMHHYTAITSKTITVTTPTTEEVWRELVPQIAFGANSQHLADSILAISALHLRSIYPHDQEIVRASHAYMASSLREYSNILTRGINATNAEALFLTSTLIAIQSTATRVFTKDESVVAPQPGDGTILKNRIAPVGGYSLPLSWFHAFQGVKALTAASWQWLRHSSVVIPIINSQPVLQLDFASNHCTHFGHLLDGLEQELAMLPYDEPGQVPPSPTWEASGVNATAAAAAAAAMFTASTSLGAESSANAQSQASSGLGSLTTSSTRQSTKQAYEHAVAVLNWAHKIPHKGSPLAFPATVSRRFVELLEERRPRALAILASFFALLKCHDSTWWLRGMARREVLGIVSLFNSDYFGPEIERQWWPHLEWSVRVALHDDRANPGYIPPELWGSSWLTTDENELRNEAPNFVSHIEMLTEMISGIQSFPAPEPARSSS